MCVSLLPGTLTEKSKFEDSEVSMVEMNSKLDHALTAKQESEAKVSGLESKVGQYEEDIAKLKEQVGWAVLFLGRENSDWKEIEYTIILFSPPLPLLPPPSNL